MTTNYWVLRPGKGMSLEKSEPDDDDLRVVFIEQTEKKDVRGIQVTLAPSWKLTSAVTKHRGNRRKEAKKLFVEYMDGRGGVIPPINLVLRVRGLSEVFVGDVDLFEEALWGHCVDTDTGYEKRGGTWHRKEARGDKGTHYKPVNLPPFWVVSIPKKGIIVYDESTVPAEVNWPRDKSPEPWRSASRAETCEEVVQAIKRRVMPFSREVYGNLDSTGLIWRT